MTTRTLYVALALAVVAAFLTGTMASAQMHRSRSMWMVPGVPDESLSSTQREQIAQIRSNQAQQIRQLQRNTSLTQSQRRERTREINERSHGQILSVLTPQQRDQFDQRHQGTMGGGPRRGAGPGRAPMVQSDWMVPGVPSRSITATQRQQISIIRGHGQEQIRDIRADKNLTQQEKNSRMAEITRNTHNQVLEVLTPDQREQYRQWEGKR